MSMTCTGFINQYVYPGLILLHVVMHRPLITTSRCRVCLMCVGWTLQSALHAQTLDYTMHMHKPHQRQMFSER